MSSPGPVPKDALNFFRAKGYKVGFDYRDVWKEEHANAFTIAKAMDIDLLSDIKSAIDSAIVEGKTLRQFQKELTPLLVKKGWWGEKEMLDPKTGEKKSVQLGSPRRLKTIYATNMRTARAAGQWDRAQRTKKYSPYFKYSLGPSQHHRDKHVSWAGMILPIDDPFWDTHYPPNGWGCKCRVRQISAREAERYGGVSKSPRLTYKIWENVRTGKKEQIPVGIDPGWNLNPGKERSNIGLKTLGENAENSNNKIANAAISAHMKSQAFSNWLKKPTGNYPVAAIDQDTAKLIGAKQNITWLSAETAKKEFTHHPELQIEEFQLIPEIIANGEIITQASNRIVYFKNADRLYKAVIKTTKDGNENYLTTFYRTGEKEKARDLNRGQKVR